MSLPTVSVVVPSFRSPARIRACVAALAAQDYPRDALEVVVVDDGSPEPLAPALADADADLRVVVHRQANAGPAAARNAGAHLAGGALLAFTDDDCEPDPGWVRALAEAHRRAPTAMLGGPVVNALPDQRCAEATQLLLAFLYQRFADDAPSRFFASNNLAAPREAFLALGGFDTTFPRPGGEDRELCERWRRRGGALVDAPAAVVRHLHAMGLRGFWRQHWNYGRGAWDVRQRRVAAGDGPVRIEPARFYLALLAFPFGRAPLGRALVLSALLAVSQVANAAGFFWERHRQRDRRRAVAA